MNNDNLFSTGQGVTDLEKELIINQALIFQQEKIAKLQKENMRLNLQITENKPKIESYEQLIDSDGLYGMDQIAKNMKMRKI
jgi:phage antirepressor YoqD-like protein